MTAAVGLLGGLAMTWISLHIPADLGWVVFVPLSAFSAVFLSYHIKSVL